MYATIILRNIILYSVTEKVVTNGNSKVRQMANRQQTNHNANRTTPPDDKTHQRDDAHHICTPLCATLRTHTTNTAGAALQDNPLCMHAVQVSS
jgi:hypothetical protein